MDIQKKEDKAQDIPEQAMEFIGECLASVVAVNYEVVGGFLADKGLVKRPKVENVNKIVDTGKVIGRKSTKLVKEVLIATAGATIFEKYIKK